MNKTNTLLNFAQAAANLVAEGLDKAAKAAENERVGAQKTLVEREPLDVWEENNNSDGSLFPGVPPISENFTPHGDYYYGDD